MALTAVTIFFCGCFITTTAVTLGYATKTKPRKTGL